MYNVEIDKFEGPLDLLLHLIKQSDIDIFDISIEVITKQYLDYIESMERLNLNIASEYLVMAAELIEMKSRTLLPNNNEDEESDYEEDPRERLINRLLEYKQYKEITKDFKDLELSRHLIYTKQPTITSDFMDDKKEVLLDDLVAALNNFLAHKEFLKPLNTKITQKEYSVSKRSREIMDVLRVKKEMDFFDLFDVYSKDYVVVSFLSILNLFKSRQIDIKQDNNFDRILLIAS